MSIPIPTDHKWKQPNNSDLFGSLRVTKNLNFDEEGYLKLAERGVAIMSSGSDANFDLVSAVGKYSSDSWRVVTIDQPWNVSLSSNISVTEDTSSGNPSLAPGADGEFWQARWYVTGSGSLTYNAAGSWTSVSLSPSLTGSVPHPLCVFQSRQTMCIGNGNGVKQINTSHADTINLVLPSDFEVNCLAYSGYRLGVGAKNTSGVGASAFFFVWDGATTSANQGVPVGATQILDVKPYLTSSFVLITSAGQLLRWNGSGLDVLANLPFYYENYDVADDNNNYLNRGRVLRVEGDVVYINFPSKFPPLNDRGERYRTTLPGGAWCWDPEVGLYHRYSHSIAIAFSKNITTANVSTSTDVITTTNVPVTGTPVRYAAGGGTVLAGLSQRKTYYTIYLPSTTLKLATSRTNALAGTAVDLTGTGSNSQYLTFYPETDFGQFAVSGRTGVMDVAGKSDMQLYGHCLLSAELYGSDLVQNGYLTLTVPGIENRGYFITPKVLSGEADDSFQSLLVKHRPFIHDVDKIIVKYKSEESTPLVQPDFISSSTSHSVTFTDSDSFTTTDDLSSVAFGDEVEVIGGAGAGQLAHISAISSSNGTYTVDLDETLRGVNANDQAYIIIDKWKKANVVISSSNSDGSIEIPIGKISKWVQFKVELRGVEVAIEQLQVIGRPHSRTK